jgi:hypothetical protein
MDNIDVGFFEKSPGSEKNFGKAVASLGDYPRLDPDISQFTCQSLFIQRKCKDLYTGVVSKAV